MMSILVSITPRPHQSAASCADTLRALHVIQGHAVESMAGMTQALSASATAAVDTDRSITRAQHQRVARHHLVIKKSQPRWPDSSAA
jgi:hypothetical protein